MTTLEITTKEIIEALRNSEKPLTMKDISRITKNKTRFCKIAIARLLFDRRIKFLRKENDLTKRYVLTEWEDELNVTNSLN